MSTEEMDENEAIEADGEQLRLLRRYAHRANKDLSKLTARLEVAERIIAEKDKAMHDAGAALMYCALEPRMLSPANNAQHCVAHNALAPLRAAIALTLDEPKP